MTKQRQSLTEYVIKEMTHHMEMTGEGITALSSRVGIQVQRLKGFMNGITSIRLDTADKILKAIEEAKTERK